MNDKIYFSAYVDSENDSDILSYDGTMIEKFEMPIGLDANNDSFYSTTQNSFYFKLRNDLNLYDVWEFDGQNFTMIETPNNAESCRILVEVNNELLLTYSTSASTGGVQTLYKLNGTNLTEILSPANTSFNLLIDAKEDKVYVRFRNLDSEFKPLYQYSFNGLELVTKRTDIQVFRYLGEYNNKDYFSFAKTDGTFLQDLYSYDGTNLERINLPNSFLPFTFSGIRNNKLYITVGDLNYNLSLVEYVAGNTDATLVPNTPTNVAEFRFLTAYGNNLFYKAGPEQFYNNLYIFNNNGFQELNIPDLDFIDYEFTIGEKLYFNFGDRNTFFRKLFSLDGTLDNPEFTEVLENPIKLFPNPASDLITLQLSNPAFQGYIKLDLISLDGKVIDTKIYDIGSSNSKTYDTSRLANGVYIFDISGEFGHIQKKFIKE